MQKQFMINFNLYEEKFLNESIEAFSGISKIYLENNTLTISGESEQKIDEIFNELMNYTLSLTLNFSGLGL